MGIPKLTANLADKIHRRSADYFEGGVFHIDGCNFAHSGEEFFKENGYIATFRHNMEILKCLKPHSIHFYFDAAYPINKLSTRLSRNKSKLKQTTWAHGFCFYEHALQELMTYHKDISITMTGAEAEDYIFYKIYSEEVPLFRRNFVFSSDSDCFTFKIPQAEMVDIVMARESSEWPENFTTYHLHEVTRSGFVEKYLHYPEEPTGLSLHNAIYPDRNTLEFLYVYKTYGQPICFLHLLPPNIVDPFQVAVDWRRAAYKAFDSSLDRVQEYRQVAKSQSEFIIEPSQEKLDYYKTKLDEDIVELIIPEIEHVLEEKLPHLRAYLNSLKNAPVPNIKELVSEPDRESYRESAKLCCLTAATILSIRMLFLSLQKEFNFYGLLWKLDPLELEKVITK